MYVATSGSHDKLFPGAATCGRDASVTLDASSFRRDVSVVTFAGDHSSSCCMPSIVSVHAIAVNSPPRLFAAAINCDPRTQLRAVLNVWFGRFGGQERHYRIRQAQTEAVLSPR
jgi:hypothetical protein